MESQTSVFCEPFRGLRRLTTYTHVAARSQQNNGTENDGFNVESHICTSMRRLFRLYGRIHRPKFVYACDAWPILRGISDKRPVVTSDNGSFFEDSSIVRCCSGNRQEFRQRSTPKVFATFATMTLEIGIVPDGKSIQTCTRGKFETALGTCANPSFNR